MSSGELVSFLLYLQSLSDAFSSIGYVFSALTQAVGAADKVFELMYRNRRGKLQQEQHPSSSTGGDEQNLVEKIRVKGLEPNFCHGEVTLKNVEMYYPARPNKRVLNDMSLSVPPGSIIALCGTSGGGKSSIISLVQHLYEQSSGKVMLDDVEVHEYSPRWLSQHISIVQQEPTLFARSIKRNIMYGLEGTDREPSQHEIERVARLSNCDDFISKVSLYRGETIVPGSFHIFQPRAELIVVPFFRRCQCNMRQKLVNVASSSLVDKSNVSPLPEHL